MGANRGNGGSPGLVAVAEEGDVEAPGDEVTADLESGPHVAFSRRAGVEYEGKLGLDGCHDGLMVANG